MKGQCYNVWFICKTHVVVDNEPAMNLYTKCEFIYESEVLAWHASFIDRPRKIILWLGLPNH